MPIVRLKLSSRPSWRYRWGYSGLVVIIFSYRYGNAASRILYHGNHFFNLKISSCPFLMIALLPPRRISIIRFCHNCELRSENWELPLMPGFGIDHRWEVPAVMGSCWMTRSCRWGRRPGIVMNADTIRIIGCPGCCHTPDISIVCPSIVTIIKSGRS